MNNQNIKKRVLENGVTQTYEVFTEDTRPQDHSGNLEGWKFEACEHGGEFMDWFPLVVKGTDPQGRTCSYHPIYIDGKAVNHLSSEFPKHD